MKISKDEFKLDLNYFVEHSLQPALIELRKNLNKLPHAKRVELLKKKPRRARTRKIISIEAIARQALKMAQKKGPL